LQRLSDGKGKDLRIHGLAALALEDMVEDVAQLKVDKAWKQHLKRIKTAQSIEPQVPKTFQAELRDYQHDGFTWLSRLAHWGVGACLADDMGLGKTLQAIALILTRCDTGPTLVIAPTSVCMNWASEAERFAPSLTVKSVWPRRSPAHARHPGSPAIWWCAVTACCNRTMRRLNARQSPVAKHCAGRSPGHQKSGHEAIAGGHGPARRLQNLTTGTPIENHLGELWNLFRFINPGLLGSLDSFNQRFANPIERDRDESAREALRRLIQPFILRRTKDQVLKELPSRTEVTLQVELSEAEMAFYEALRREAVEKLADSDANAGQKHLQVLAEIMRLRRACCNPQLVRPELGLPSAKLDQFGEVLAEILDNDHKALVFSQFVDHLTILREYLDRQKIAYQYLDGSTPAKQRKKRVDAFQNGEGDVFLISLKAGGTGLNLTAADFVIHMDPWWNPAVEDQASDRAHRIGQQRPVTIYRLVAKGTIEDKIVALHKTKRDLADSLLAGADVSSKISTDQLLSLIQT
jgi:SNF2 family DNA or RNA helicase